MIKRFQGTFALLSINCIIRFHLLFPKSFVRSDCLPSWTINPHSGTCLRTFYSPATWMGADRICNDHGGELVKIPTEDDDTLVSALVADTPFLSSWIGLRYTKAYGFRWNYELGVANYIPMAPTLPTGNDDACVTITKEKDSDSMAWTLNPCQKSLKVFVCESFPDCNTLNPGEVCKKICSKNCNGTVETLPGEHPVFACDVRNGKCFSGCTAGYKGDTCDTECQATRYGPNCAMECSENCAESKNCNAGSGECIGGCKPGYSGPTCKTGEDKKDKPSSSCDEVNMHGANCEKSCSPGCAGALDACDRLQGTCSCDAGYTGPKCDIVCINCTVVCSPHCGGLNKTCYGTNGTCIEGCELGYEGHACNETTSDESSSALLSITETTSDESSSAKVVLAWTIGAICLVIALVTAAILAWSGKCSCPGGRVSDE